MGQTNSIHIYIVNRATLILVKEGKCIHRVVLVPNDPATHSAVVDSIHREGNRGTSRSTGSPTHSLWTSDGPETRWTVFLRVSHVQFSYSHPA